ncbi:hypothetical protein ACHAXR_012263 [Thalassiosira sp. AJA248-18]
MISTSVKEALRRLSGGGTKSSSSKQSSATHQKSQSNKKSQQPSQLTNNNGTTNTPSKQHESTGTSQDEMFLRLRREAAEVVKREPILSMLLSKVGLLDESTLPKLSSSNNPIPAKIITASLEPATSFEEVIARIVAHRLSSCSGGTENICPKFLRHLLEQSFHDTTTLELGHTMSEAVREDAMAILRRDPAAETLLEVVLFMKGFHSLVIHRAARRAWKPALKNKNDDTNDASASNETNVAGSRFVALLLQSQSSSAFGVDIHPASSIGMGVMIDHASGVVIGETATVGDGTTILHGVTLGGTGKDHGDRHPKIGKDVLIGAGTQILGNITVGDRAKIGAGSVVLRPIPSGATAVGAPAKIIGYTPKGERPGSSVDIKLEGVEPLFGGGKMMGGGRGSVSSDSITEGTTDSSGGSSPGSSGSGAGTTETTSDEKTQTMKKLALHNEKADVEDNNIQKSNTIIDEEEEDDDAQDKDSSNDEDDDNVTDFGTQPKCRWVQTSNHNDGLCPFSGSFRNISSSLRPNTISHPDLRALLIQEGCTEGECAEVFFGLLHCTPASSKARQCGCIPLDIFMGCFPEIAKEKTKLDGETIQALAVGDLRTLAMSKKASRRFRSMFAVLGQKSALALPRIPSSGLLSDGTDVVGSCSAIRKSERERMGEHLDTRTYSAEITI